MDAIANPYAPASRIASRSPSSARGQFGVPQKAVGGLADRTDDVGDDGPVIWNGIHIFDFMRGLVQRRPQEVVHPGVGDHERLAALLLDVEHARQQHARRAGDGAARLDQGAERPARERGEHGRGVGFRRHGRLADPDSSADVECFDRKAGRGQALRQARQVPRGLGERPGLQDLASDVRLNADHADAGKAAGLLEDRARPPDVHAELVLLQARRDVRMRLRVDVRVDPQGHSRRLAALPRDRVDLLDLPLGLGVEGEDPGRDARRDLVVRLAHAGEDDPFRRDPALQRRAQLAAGHDVGARAEA